MYAVYVCLSLQCLSTYFPAEYLENVEENE